MSTAADRQQRGADPSPRDSRRRERRRRIQAREFDTSVPSPCISVCELDSSTNLCLGCRRHVDEIRDWPIMTADEKRDAWARIEARKAADAESGSAPASDDATDPSG